MATTQEPHVLAAISAITRSKGSARVAADDRQAALAAISAALSGGCSKGVLARAFGMSESGLTSALIRAGLPHESRYRPVQTPATRPPVDPDKARAGQKGGLTAANNRNRRSAEAAASRRYAQDAERSSIAAGITPDIDF